jgi:hypothetical protein
MKKGAPWSSVETHVHRTSTMEVTNRDGKVWVAGTCETPEELRDLAALLEYLAAETEGKNEMIVVNREDEMVVTTRRDAGSGQGVER